MDTVDATSRPSTAHKIGDKQGISEMPKLRLSWVLLLLLALYVEEADSKKKKKDEFEYNNDYQYYAPYDYNGGAYVDPLQPYYGVVYGITAPVLLLFIYVAAVGIRGFDVRKWMVLNLLMWMLWYAMLNSDGADHSPWKGWLGIEYDANTYWQELALSSLTGSLCLLYVESIVTSILYINHPKSRYSLLYNIIWFFFYVPFLNGVQIFCWIAKYYIKNTTWWYDPVDTLLCTTYIFAQLLWIIHFIVALVLSLIIPICSRHKDPSTEVALFPVGKMWLVFIYGLIPQVILIPYISVPLLQFLFTQFSDQMFDLMQMFTGGGGGMGDPYWLNMGLQFMGYRDYFMLYMPLILTALSVLCFPCFYRPLIIVLTCGRICASSGKRALHQRSPPPSYPGNQNQEKKIPPT